MNIGDTIDGKYLIIEEIGEGGMGTVFKVQHGDDLFALKVCKENDEESIKRFKREVRLMSRIKHENVIEVLDCNLDVETPYFVMPLCKCSIDSKLDELQKNHGLAIDIILQACKGINAIHLSGAIHRDIKPKNILISMDNKVKISDLGLGKFDDRDSTILTSSNVYMGTQGFMPPEFFLVGGTKNANFQSDVYQIGKTIYNILTNRNPVLIERHLLPGGLEYIILKCLHDSPGKRYKTVGELGDALNSYVESLKPAASPASVYENLIGIAKENLKKNVYDRGNVEKIVSTLFEFRGDPESFFRHFNHIPEEILETIAANFLELCSDLLRVYSEETERFFTEFRISFSDAELVANAMFKVFKNSNDLTIKVTAMRITLFASVFCNRYNAMGVFDKMLQSIKHGEEAFAIVQMLRDNVDDYAVVADRIPAGLLHPLIQKLQEELVEKEEKESTSHSGGLADW